MQPGTLPPDSTMSSSSLKRLVQQRPTKVPWRVWTVESSNLHGNVSSSPKVYVQELRAGGERKLKLKRSQHDIVDGLLCSVCCLWRFTKLRAQVLDGARSENPPDGGNAISSAGHGTRS